MASPFRAPRLAFASLLVARLAAQAPDDLADRIVEQGIARSQVMQFQDVLCHDFGSRLTGSGAFDRAAQWAREAFQTMGLQAQLMQWGTWQVRWDREQWQGRVVEPEGLELQVACPAWTGSTRGISRGTLVAMPKTAEELHALTQRCEEQERLWLWGALSKDSELAAVRDGVLALLGTEKLLGIAQSATSTGWNDARYPNQIRVFGDSRNAQKSYDERPRWGHAVVRDDQSATIDKLLASGKPVVVEFELRNRFRPGPVPLYNVVADLPGTSAPDDMVIVCAHLDSWHQATGATDNGTGTCSTLEAARILTAAGAKPKRTIRFILWGGEEQGLLGSRQYVVQHRTQMDRVSAVFNHDSGTNWMHALGIAESHAADFGACIAPLLTRLRVPEAGFDGAVFALQPQKVMQPAGGGSDHASFASVGVPAFSWNLRGEVPYARGWHSQWDQIAIVQPAYQQHNATTIAMVVFGIANLDHNLSREGVERAKPGGLVNAQLIVETWLGIELDGLTVQSANAAGLAARSGVRSGDVLSAVGEQATADAPSFLSALRERSSQGQDLQVTVQRGGSPLALVLQAR